MSDFRSGSSFVKCDHLKIGGVGWPKQYTTDNAYLKFTNTNGCLLYTSPSPRD